MLTRLVQKEYATGSVKQRDLSMTTTSTFAHTHIYIKIEEKKFPTMSQVLLCTMKGSSKKKRKIGVHGSIHIVRYIQGV